MSTEVLLTSRNFFKAIDLLDSGNPRTKSQKVKNFVFISIELVVIVIPALVYFLQNIHNIRKATESMYGFCAYSNTFGMHLYFFLKQKSLLKVMNELQELVESRKSRPYFLCYQATETKFTKFTQTFTIFIFVVCSIVVFMPYIIASIFKFQLDYLFLAFKTTYPFDQRSLVGFLVGSSLQTLAAWKFLASFCAINTFYIGASWYVATCVNDIQTIFDEIELHLTESESDETNKSNGTSLKRFAIRRALLEAVEFHNKILEFLTHFASLMDGVIFSTFSFGTIWLSTSLAQYMDFDIAMFQTTVSNMLITVWLFVYCHYGTLITWKCCKIADFAYHSKFYKYPMDLQLFTLFMIERSQKPFYITGYRITKCSLESYGRFMNTALSFYMVFRNLSK